MSLFLLQAQPQDHSALEPGIRIQLYLVVLAAVHQLADQLAVAAANLVRLVVAVVVKLALVAVVNLAQVVVHKQRAVVLQ